MSDGTAEVRTPATAGPIVDAAPVVVAGRSVWLVLGEAGQIGRWDPSDGSYRDLAATTVRAETGNVRLHAGADGEFAAVVNDYGHVGEVLDLGSGRVTMVLDSDGDDQQTVPFSLVFARHGGSTVVVHRTAWNRLDVSDPATGTLLTERPASDEHHLDYYHGALYLSPDGRRVLDDGWIWHPVGFPAVWSLERWLADNPFESEDGPSRLDVCGREYYWDHPMTWIDDTRVAIEGIGDDHRDIQPGARIFDTTRTERLGLWRMETAAEIARIPGPAGRFFSDGTHLFSSAPDGLQVWNPVTGAQIATVPGFVPTHRHPVSGEFLELGGDRAAVLREVPLGG
jgi:hypothetical protein